MKPTHLPSPSLRAVRASAALSLAISLLASAASSARAFDDSVGLEGSDGVAGTAASLANYQPTRMIELRPSEKRPLMIRSDERNPYARRSPDQETDAEEGETIQDLRVRETLSSLSVTGRSEGPNGPRLLLGDIIIEEGRILPPLLEDQSEDLQVLEIGSRAIVFAWLDIETREPTGKTMQIGYDLSPSVAYALHGQARDRAGDEGDAAPRMAILRPHEEERRARARLSAAAAEAAPKQDLPEEVIQAGQ